MNVLRRVAVALLGSWVLVLAAGGGVEAQQSASKWVLKGDTRWMVIASSPDQDEAIGIAGTFIGFPHEVRVIRLRNRRFAVVAGPVKFATPQAFVASLKDQHRLPEDVYSSLGNDFVEQVWIRTARQPVKLEFDGKDAKSLKHENIEIRTQLKSLGAAQVAVELLVLVDGNEVIRTIGTKENYTPEPTATAEIIRLDKTSKFPQIVFTTFTGGAHCCYENKILTSNARGEWTVVDGITSDFGYRFEDINSDGNFELISADESFLYKFSPYVDSHPPVRIQSLTGNKLEVVTTLPAFRGFLRRDVFAREFNARTLLRFGGTETSLWNSNGFLAGWVAAKALIGELNDAWARMLVTYDRVWDYKYLGCPPKEVSTNCPASEIRKTSFLRALVDHLKANGYGNVGAVKPEPKYQLAIAQQAFSRLSLQEKYRIEQLLAIADFWDAVTFDQLTDRLFAALTNYQEAIGAPITGVLTTEQLQLLHEKSSEALRLWNLVVITHPVANAKLWVPKGLNFDFKAEGGTYVLTSKDFGASIVMGSVTGTLDEFYRFTLDRRQRDSQVPYHVSTRKFFVVVSDRGDVRRYSRFADTDAGVVGFTLIYRRTDPIFGDQLATIMSDLFRANVELGRNISPPIALATSVKRHESPPRSQPNSPSKNELISQGTAFVVSKAGHFATNAHVVEKCPRAVIMIDGKSYPAQIVARDNGSDLALLKTDFVPSVVPSIRRTVRSGEDIAVFGFPHFGTLSPDGVFTRGNITALSGPNNDHRFLQMQAPIHQGNSGGPMIDTAGNVTGVVTMKLLFVQKDLAQNLNFAVKGSVLAEFLDRQAIAFNEKQEITQLQGADLSDRARKFTGLVVCREQ
ncbi:MAG: trypsin-like peptidase domain-containing protein [Xanthobacteraceae bacterium]|nr:trypsin-like peptidase domain-containing protein [Xanthobacteraceae bacterium]